MRIGQRAAAVFAGTAQEASGEADLVLYQFSFVFSCEQEADHDVVEQLVIQTLQNSAERRFAAEIVVEAHGMVLTIGAISLESRSPIRPSRFCGRGSKARRRGSCRPSSASSPRRTRSATRGRS